MIRKGNSRACATCLRRSQLLARLAPCIEKITTGAPGNRAPELLRLGNEDLAAVAAPKAAAQVLAQIEALPEKRLREDLASANCWAFCRHDPFFPAGLRDAPDAPWAIFGCGDPTLLRDLEPMDAVAIVGVRHATVYGREVAFELGRDLAAAGLVVISGLAFGVDACAHRGALEGGRTIAVLATGSDVAYPAAHRSLRERICERGAVVSEMPPGTGAWRWSFPARSRIVAALAASTILVEAGECSGSMITAEMARQMGRELGAVPGPVNSKVSAGPNRLLVEGARVIRGAEDLPAAAARGRKEA